MVGGLLGLPLIPGCRRIGSSDYHFAAAVCGGDGSHRTTLMGLFRTIKRPVDMVSEGWKNARQRREEERLILERDAQIDVPLEPQLPAHPVRAETPASLFPPPPEKKKAEKKNDSWNA